MLETRVELGIEIQFESEGVNELKALDEMKM